MKPYRILYNQDSTNLFYITPEPITPLHVDRMVDEVADGGADVMLINTGAQRVNFPSRSWQTFWDGYVPGQRAFFGPVPDEEVPHREAMVAQMKRLADQGCNYLARALARCRQRGIAPGVTFRMNDMHDAPTPSTHLFSRFYLEHPEYHLDNGPFPGWSARGLNYAIPQVREHFLAHIRELVSDYDIDVLELDFLRFHCYFPRPVSPTHVGVMTDFMRQVRALTAAAPRPIALMARVAATPAAALELGFDVAAWAREGLVDAISAGAFLATQWLVPVDEFKALVGDAVAVYACADFPADRRPDLPMRQLSTSPELLRGFAAGHFADGADGVELFNFFCSRETSWQIALRDPAFATLREMAQPAGLRGRPKQYLLSCGTSQGEVDGAFQVPVPLHWGMSRAFEMLLAAEADATPVAIDVVFTAPGDQASNVCLWLHLNHTSLGQAPPAVPLPEAPGTAWRATFKAPARALRHGRNRLLLRNETNLTVTVVGIDVRVL